MAVSECVVLTVKHAGGGVMVCVGAMLVTKVGVNI